MCVCHTSPISSPHYTNEGFALVTCVFLSTRAPVMCVTYSCYMRVLIHKGICYVCYIAGSRPTSEGGFCSAQLLVLPPSASQPPIALITLHGHSNAQRTDLQRLQASPPVHQLPVNAQHHVGLHVVEQGCAILGDQLLQARAACTFSCRAPSALLQAYPSEAPIQNG